ncbi:MAG TPA: hypothetical protein VGL09_14490 [Methylomirabilota bacterium]|jgi:hypothetical protein
MNVMAFSTPARPEWRWRIVSYAGEIVEESRETFSTIAAAVARGTERVVAMNANDRWIPSSRPATGYLRGR